MDIKLNYTSSLPTLLTIVFMVLKLTGVIAWSWLWVLSPLWIFVGLILLIFIIFFILGLIFN